MKKISLLLMLTAVLFIFSGRAKAELVHSCEERIHSNCHESSQNRCRGSRPDGKYCIIRMMNSNDKCFCWEPIPTPPVEECPDDMDLNNDETACLVRE
ncbi:MAG: hypothetical protein J5787_03500 [Alphaproteobacteria bacterium]|nr:hypothetical protein [Alphaproteobacteria bacterium]